MQCLLCQSSDVSPYFQEATRSYFQCQTCNLVFVPEQYHLTQQEEKTEYDKHENDPLDIGYQNFLARTTKPLFKLLSPQAKGLDFGCGSAAAISHMAKAQGIDVVNYDLYYFNHPELLETQYDFITMTEVIEHLAEPNEILKVIAQALKKYGIFAVMTKRVIDKTRFATWHYKNDPSHIAFYSEKTFEWIAKRMNWRLQIVDKDVVFFHKE